MTSGPPWCSALGILDEIQFISATTMRIERLCMGALTGETRLTRSLRIFLAAVVAGRDPCFFA
jgi:hypothetical protein